VADDLHFENRVKTGLCRLIVGLALGVLAPVAPAFAQAATPATSADPLAKSVESARGAREQWLETARSTSPFQPKGDQRWPPAPTPLPDGDVFRAPPDTYRATPETYAPRSTPYRPPLQSPPLATGYSYRPPAGYEPYFPSATRPYAPRYWEAPRPGNVDVFVDGRLYGTVDSLQRQGGLQLLPGLHQVDLRAVGFPSSAYTVSVPPQYYRPVSAYDGRFYVPVSAAPVGYASYPSYRSWPISSFGVRHVPQRVPRSVYVVSRCYAGDEPPKEYQLPAGCTGPATSVR
jgi:hypothetical protein